MIVIDTNLHKDPNEWVQILRAERLAAQAYLQQVNKDLEEISNNHKLPKELRTEATMELNS